MVLHLCIFGFTINIRGENYAGPRRPSNQYLSRNSSQSSYTVKIPVFSYLICVIGRVFPDILEDCLTLKIKALRSIETSRSTCVTRKSHTTGCEDGCANLKSHIYKLPEQRLITQNSFTEQDILQSL